MCNQRAQGWRSGESTWPPTNVAQVWFPDSASQVGEFCFSSQLWEVFLRVLRFSRALLNTGTERNGIYRNKPEYAGMRGNDTQMKGHMPEWDRMNKNGAGIYRNNYQNESEWHTNKPEYAGTRTNDSGIKPNDTGMRRNKQEWYRNIPERGRMTTE